MSRDQLDEADKRAVDMLLNQLPQSHDSNYTPSLSAVDPARLEAARRTLHLLDNYEVGEPPADLLARTMARVGQAPSHEAPLYGKLPSNRLDA